MDLTPFIAAWQAHNWVLFAALTIGAFIALSKQGWFGAYVQAHMPARALPYYAVALSVIGAATTEIVAGVPLNTALAHAAAAALLAIVGHNVVIEGLRSGKEIVPEKAAKGPPPMPVQQPQAEPENSVAPEKHSFRIVRTVRTMASAAAIALGVAGAVGGQSTDTRAVRASGCTQSQLQTAENGFLTAEEIGCILDNSGLLGTATAEQDLTKICQFLPTIQPALIAFLNAFANNPSAVLKFATAAARQAALKKPDSGTTAIDAGQGG